MNFKKKQFDRFMYWIIERHKIHLKRHSGLEKPWTTDTVLQQYFFTNPYRENDKVTIWFRENFRQEYANNEEVLMGTIIFRWFNKIETGELLLEHNLLTEWKMKKAIRLVGAAAKKGPVFTGAYMIKAGNGPPGCKVRLVCEGIQRIWKERARLVDLCVNGCSMQQLHKELCKFKGLGPFMSYEVVCDLRYTFLLKDSPDIMTWANPGPGAYRGIARMYGYDPADYGRGKMPKVLDDPNTDMQRLLKMVNSRLPKSMPRFEMREVEHSLCEFDKYMRATNGNGKMKRRYQGA